MSILTAQGFTQFSALLPNNTPEDGREMKVSHLEPFSARVDIELIQTPSPLKKHLSYDTTGGSTTYIHVLINQRTLDLHKQYSQCSALDSGWCELNNFLTAAADLYELSEYEYACFGNYSPFA